MRGRLNEEIRNKAWEAFQEVRRAGENGEVVPSQRELAQKYGVKQQYLSYYFRKFEKETGASEPESLEKAAAGGVTKVLATNISTEAQNRTAQYLEVGKETSRAFYNWGSTQGYSPNQLAETDVAEVVVDALNFYVEGKQLKEENARLREALRFAQERINPIRRLELGLGLLNELAEVVAVARLLGVNLLDTRIPEYYQGLLEQFLIGAS